MKNRKYFTIALLFLIIGWFPSMLLGVIFKNTDVLLGIIVLCITLLSCVFASMYLFMHFPPTSYWKSQDEIDSLRQKFKDKILEYEEAKDILSNEIIKLNKRT